MTHKLLLTISYVITLCILVHFITRWALRKYKDYEEKNHKE